MSHNPLRFFHTTTSLTSDHRRHIFEESPCESFDAICGLCKKNVYFQSFAYYCRECRSNFHKDCLTLTDAKIHEHTLTFIRRESSFRCDVCGVDDGIGLYGCLQCDFFVHRDCTYLPKVIKITRHSHRLFHFLRLSDGDNNNNICGVCHRIDIVGYGGYSCIRKRCNYFVHSYCVNDMNVWDGIDLEGEPELEEIDSEVDLAALVEIDGNTKRYFSHDHNLLRLDVDDQEEREQQVCQACILPIEFGSFLCCKKCNFALHQVCASLPRKMEHPIHRHPLFIHVDTMNTENGFFTCSVCNQHSCGFMYKCNEENTTFITDVKCASFAEPFNHSAHEHPLYVSIYEFTKYTVTCSGCNQSSAYAANCSVCDFPLDFKCVNLPKLVKYKYDIHPLVLYFDKDLRHRLFVEPLGWWCEICEKVIDENTIVYTFHDCFTTLHVDCLLGKYPYLKFGHKIKVSGFQVEIASNNGVSRPICHTCQCICQDKLVFKGRDDLCFCSFECIPSTS